MIPTVGRIVHVRYPADGCLAAIVTKAVEGKMMDDVSRYAPTLSLTVFTPTGSMADTAHREVSPPLSWHDPRDCPDGQPGT